MAISISDSLASLNLKTGLADPLNVTPIVEPLPNPNPDHPFFLLTPNADQVEIVANVQATFPSGILGLDGDDFVRGSANPEILNGNSGQDCLLGKEGNDTIRGSPGFDVIAGGEGDDFLNGNKGGDYVYGNGGSDRIWGGLGNDNLVGNVGNDTLTGDLGIDKLWGGLDTDVFVLPRGSAEPPQMIGTPEPPPDLFADLEAVTADMIIDYNAAEGDVIGLTDGLTADDLLLTERSMTIGDSRDYDPSGPFPLGEFRTLEFRVETTQVTVITEATTGNVLGLVKATPAAQIQFVSLEN